MVQAISKCHEQFLTRISESSRYRPRMANNGY